MQRLVTDVGYPIERVTSQRGRMASAASAAIGSIATTVSAAMVAAIDPSGIVKAGQMGRGPTRCRHPVLPLLQSLTIAIVF